MSDAPTVHASCVVVGEAGVLIRGPSGSGKSSLACALIERAAADGMFGRLVADDRARLTVVHGRLLAEPPAALAGLVERRGLGLLRAPWIAQAVVRLVVDLDENGARLPPPEALVAAVCGLQLPRVTVAWARPEAVSTVFAALRTWFSPAGCGPCALAFAAQHEKMIPSAPPAAPLRPALADRRGGHDPERNTSCAETA